MIDDDVSPQALADAVKHTHGCDARFLDRVEVVEKLGDETIWDGGVSIFEIAHPSGATRAYAWPYPTEGENAASLRSSV